MIGKRGVMSVLATIFLILLVVILGVLTLSWFFSITGNVVTIQGKAISQVCGDVDFNVDYAVGEFQLQNIGNVGLYDLNLIFENEEGYETKSAREIFSNWPEEGLGLSQVFSESISIDAGVNKIRVVPVLRGFTEDGKEETYVCSGIYGKNIYLN